MTFMHDGMGFSCCSYLCMNMQEYTHLKNIYIHVHTHECTHTHTQTYITACVTGRMTGSAVDTGDGEDRMVGENAEDNFRIGYGMYPMVLTSLCFPCFLYLSTVVFMV